ncbi:MAG: RdgB/HAM1 family non-canonical purine NTP pyrophosphatase [Tepidiformaceae bacterium]
MERLLLATNNAGKVRELRRLLAGCGWETATPADMGIALEVVEDGATYAENAALKAQAFADASGYTALADDSGLEVDALGGRPGLQTARYGGKGLDDAGRVALLLRELAGVLGEARGARFRSLIAIALPAARGGEQGPWLFEGVREGRIAHVPRGAGGFGYDPVFIVDGARTMAELGDEEKDRISHRGIAARAAAEWLRGAAR